MNINNPQELLDYMDKNFSYGYLDKNGNIHRVEDADFDDVWYDSYVLENYDDVLRTNIGNCFDMTEFEREWFTSHGYKVSTFFEMVVLPYENIYPTHSFLVFEKDNKYYHFEYSDFYNRGIHEYDSLEELLDRQFDTYLKYLDEFNIKEEEKKNIILKIFDRPKEHISAKEYLDHASLDSTNLVKGRSK